MDAKLKNNLIIGIIFLLSLIIADICTDFKFYPQVEPSHLTEYSVVENCMNSILHCLVDHTSSGKADNKSGNDYLSGLDEFFVGNATIVHHHEFYLSHTPPMHQSIAKDVFIEVISPPPLLSI